MSLASKPNCISVNSSHAQLQDLLMCGSHLQRCRPSANTMHHITICACALIALHQHLVCQFSFFPSCHGCLQIQLTPHLQEAVDHFILHTLAKGHRLQLLPGRLQEAPYALDHRVGGGCYCCCLRLLVLHELPVQVIVSSLCAAQHTITKYMIKRVSPQVGWNVCNVHAHDAGLF